MDKARYAEILLDLKALSIDPSFSFTWASGIQSPIYCDNRILLSYPQEREVIMDGLLELINENFNATEMLAGTATAGIAPAAFLAQSLELPMVYVRSSAKGHGKGNTVEGRLQPGQKTLVIEDLISTGKSSMQAVRELRQAGADVIGVVSIFTYGLNKARDLFQEENVKTLSLLSMPEMLELSTSLADTDKTKIADFLKQL